VAVYPRREHGTKAPRGKEWKTRQAHFPTPRQLQRWYVQEHCTGLGAICGSISRNLEVFEFDAQGKTYADFKDTAGLWGV
jgi:hypothetical protein